MKKTKVVDILCGESSGVLESTSGATEQRAARQTIRRVGKFPPFPAELNRQQLTIEVPLAFRFKTD
jgi:protein TonB